MKYVLLILLMNLVHAAPTTGNTEGCPERAQLLANEGERFVHVMLNGKTHKLSANRPFSLKGKEPVTFRSEGDPMRGTPSMEFRMTSVVMSSLPRLIVSYSGRQENCRVNIYGPGSQKQN